jgi:hypothetical protein
VRLDHLRANTNFSTKQLILKDKHLTINVFVNYEKLGMNGALLVKQVAHEEETKDTSAADSSDFTSDEDDHEEAKHTEEEEEAEHFVNQYTVDLIAEYKDREEELILHWALGKRTASEWAKPDDLQMPKGSIRWKDNIATQTPFEANLVYPEYRSIQFVFRWIDQIEADKIVQAINFVVLERKKNFWYNNGGQNY